MDNNKSKFDNVPVVKLGWFITAILAPFDAALLLPIQIGSFYLSVFRLFFALMIFLSVLKIFKTGYIPVRRPALAMTFFSFWVVWMIITLIWTDDLILSLKGLFNIIILFGLVLVGIYLKVKGLAEIYLIIVWFISVTAAFIEELTGIRFEVSRQYDFIYELTSLYHNPSFFGATICLIFPWILWRILDNKTKRKSFFIAAALITVYMVVRTGSKGVLGAILLEILITTILSLGHAKFLFRIILIILTAIIFIWQVISFGLIDPLLVDKLSALIAIGDISSWTSGSGSFGIRAVLWQMGMNIFLDSPVLGNGIGTSSFLMLMSGGYQGISAIHNWWLEIMIEGGMVGLMLFTLAYLIILLKLLPKKDKVINQQEVIPSLLTLIAFPSISLTVGSVSILWAWWVIFGVAIGVGHSITKKEDKNEKA